MNLYEYVTGKMKKEEALPMIPVGWINYSDVLDMYVITIPDVGDYFIQEIPKQDEVQEVFKTSE